MGCDEGKEAKDGVVLMRRWRNTPPHHRQLPLHHPQILESLRKGSRYQITCHLPHTSSCSLRDATEMHLNMGKRMERTNAEVVYFFLVGAPAFSAALVTLPPLPDVFSTD